MKWVIEDGKHQDRKKAAHAFNEMMKDPKAGAPQAVGDPEAEQYYIIINENVKLEKNDEASFKFNQKIPNEFKTWVTYPVTKPSPNLQKNYEIFCGGWLHFWDLEISVEKEHRQLYFEWHENRVIIYISQPTGWKRSYKIALIIDGPGDPPVVPPPPPPGD